MGLTIAQKIIQAHLVKGSMKVGEEVALCIAYTPDLVRNSGSVCKYPNE